jgi:hypothetical protein
LHNQTSPQQPTTSAHRPGPGLHEPQIVIQHRHAQDVIHPMVSPDSATDGSRAIHPTEPADAAFQPPGRHPTMPDADVRRRFETSVTESSVMSHDALAGVFAGQYGVRAVPGRDGSRETLGQLGRRSTDHAPNDSSAWQVCGLGRPETFHFLGFTHICARTRNGRFMLKRITISKRMRAKLREVKEELARRRHQPVLVQGERLGSVVRGHLAYYAVPGNGKAIWVFRGQVTWHWRRALRHRSQRTRLNWERMSSSANPAASSLKRRLATKVRPGRPPRRRDDVRPSRFRH